MGFEYLHTVGLEETNIVGNVYYVNYVRWQGRCRENFLKLRAPEVLADLQADLTLFTLRVDCDFFAELTAFDDVSIRMHLVELADTQIGLGFDYVRMETSGAGTLVARGGQRLACMRRGPSAHAVPARVPDGLARALELFARSS